MPNIDPWTKVVIRRLPGIMDEPIKVKKQTLKRRVKQFMGINSQMEKATRALFGRAEIVEEAEDTEQLEIKEKFLGDGLHQYHFKLQ